MKDMRRSIRSPSFIREPLFKRLKPDSERLSPVKPLRFAPSLGMDDDGDILGRVVVVARFEAERDAVAFVEPDHDSHSNATASQRGGRVGPPQ